MIIANASTDVTTYFVLRDSTNHAPKTDITVTDLDLYYVEQGAAISSKTDATALDAADSAHSDNKAFHVGQGLYRIDWPDAAFDGGIGKRVILIVVCTGVDTTFLEVELSPKVETASITSGAITAAAIATDAIDADAIKADAATEIADALLNRDMSAVTVTNDRSPINALRFLRNKWSLSGATLTVCKEDDATEAWHATVTTSEAAVPVTGSDPA